MKRMLSGFVALVVLSGSAVAIAEICGASDNAQEAIELLERQDPRDPVDQRELDAAIDALYVLLESDCDDPALERAEAHLGAYGLDLLNDAGTTASGCGTEARNDFKECQEDCKAAGKKLCGCAAAWVIDVIGCVGPLK